MVSARYWSLDGDNEKYLYKDDDIFLLFVFSHYLSTTLKLFYTRVLKNALSSPLVRLKPYFILDFRLF